MLELSYIDISMRWVPSASTFNNSWLKFALVNRPIEPDISTMFMKMILFIYSLIYILIIKNLMPFSMLKPIFEGTFICRFTHFKQAMTTVLVILPLSLIFISILINYRSFSIFEIIFKITLINIILKLYLSTKSLFYHILRLWCFSNIKYPRKIPICNNFLLW